MKRMAKYLFGLLIAFITFPLLTSTATAQERANKEVRASPNASVSQTIGTTQVTITYGRPGVKDRQIFANLVPYDKVWRTGANEATTISFSSDVKIEGNPLEAGTYSLFTIPGKDEWKIIFNSVVQQWGAYDYNPEKNVLEVTVEPQKAEKQEWLRFYFPKLSDTKATCVLHWSTVKVPFTITVE